MALPNCLDCQIKLKDFRSKRCRKCVAKIRSIIWKGLRRSPKTEFKKGIKSPFKGKKRLNISGENHPNWKGGPPKCLECGKETNKSSYKAKYCFEHKGIQTRREKNYRWKGGKYTTDYRERRRFRIEMQKLVFERDRYTCQLCGSKKDLQVDHIQPWAEYIELRFKLENCRTMCAKCHYLITFGKPMPKNVKGWGHNLLKGGRFP